MGYEKFRDKYDITINLRMIEKNLKVHYWNSIFVDTNI